MIEIYSQSSFAASSALSTTMSTEPAERERIETANQGFHEAPDEPFQ